MRDERFKWDDGKAASNRRKHGVTFEQGREAFDDHNGFGEDDDDPDGLRWRHFGMTSSGILVVVYTERGDHIRIISAREAEPNEHDRYYRQAPPRG